LKAISFGSPYMQVAESSSNLTLPGLAKQGELNVDILDLDFSQTHSNYYFSNFKWSFFKEFKNLKRFEV